MRLRRRHRLNYRLAYVLFASSLHHYSNIMQRILLVYTLYVGAHFVLLSGRLRPRTYRLLRLRGPVLPALHRCAGTVPAWSAWLLLWRWTSGLGGLATAGVPCTAGLQTALLNRVRLLVDCGYMQDSVAKKYRVSPLRRRAVVLSGGASSHLWVCGRRLWVDRFIGGALLPRLDYSLWIVYKQMQFHMDMGSRRGARYQACLPLHGQRTRTNSRTVRQVTQALLNRF